MKRFLTAFLLVCVMLVAKAQDMVDFTVKGNASVEAKEVEVFNASSVSVMDTLSVVNGNFTFSGKLPNGTMLYFRADNNKRMFCVVFVDGKDSTSFNLNSLNEYDSPLYFIMRLTMASREIAL